MFAIGLYILLGVLTALSAVLLNLAYRLLRADPLESEKSASRLGSIKNALLGYALINDDWMPDARVKGGLIFNRKMNRIEISGRLSDDSLHRAFR